MFSTPNRCVTLSPISTMHPSRQLPYPSSTTCFCIFAFLFPFLFLRLEQPLGTLALWMPIEHPGTSTNKSTIRNCGISPCVLDDLHLWDLSKFARQAHSPHVCVLFPRDLANCLTFRSLCVTAGWDLDLVTDAIGVTLLVSACRGQIQNLTTCVCTSLIDGGHLRNMDCCLHLKNWDESLHHSVPRSSFVQVACRQSCQQLGQASESTSACNACCYLASAFVGAGARAGALAAWSSSERRSSSPPPLLPYPRRKFCVSALLRYHVGTGDPWT